jgi:peptide/nickel transport system permease protein
LTITAFIFSFTAAIGIGVLSATRRYTFWDHVTTGFGFGGIAIPSFFLGIMLMVLFSIKLGWLPSGGRYTYGKEGDFIDLVKHMIMPVFVMGINDIAGTSRFVRTSLLEVLRLDYVRTARAKGLGERIVIYRHALRNAIMPVITLLGLGLPGFVGGALVVENLFSWPGMGRLAVGAVFQKDYNVIMGVNIMFAFLTVLGNLIADLLYATVDPRVKFS